MRGSLLAALLVLLPASSGVLRAAQGEKGGAGEPSTPLGSEIEGLIREMKPLEKRLIEFQRRFPDPAQPDAFPPERKAAQVELHGRLVRAIALLAELQRQRKQVEIQEGIQLLGRTKRRDPQGMRPGLRDVYQGRTFSSYALQSVSATERMLTQDFMDSNRHDALMAEARKARSTSRLLAGLALVLAAGALAWARRRRRAQASDAEALPPAPEQAQLPGPPLPAAAPDGGPLKGAVLGGRFRIQEPLGPGSLGDAFKARDAETGREVQLLRVRREIHDSERDLDRFLDQARRAARLSHANIGEVFSIFIEEDRVHIASELIQGTPLERLLEERRGCDPEALKRLSRQVLDALGHAHDAGVLHGALSPVSIVVGERELVKVRDFAIGAELRRIAAKLKWSVPKGSAAYLAPEQEVGQTLPESDLYSAAVVLYQAATGRLPFAGPDYLAQKRAERCVPPSSVNGLLPKELDAVLARALKADPSTRFRRAQDLRVAIELAGADTL